MKQRGMIVILCIVLSAVAAHAAELELSESTIDYGTVKEGPPIIKTITLTNKGTLPLEIANAAAS